MALPISFGTYSNRHGLAEATRAFLPWEPAFKVGDWEIDRQHRLLIGLINQLHECISEADQDHKLQAVFAATGEFLRNHFEFEESCLERLGGAELTYHRESHQALLDRLSHLRQLLSAGSCTMSPELVQFLKEWATTHMLQCERRLAGRAVRQNQRTRAPATVDVI